jgi:hypothetical protein
MVKGEANGWALKVCASKKSTGFLGFGFGFGLFMQMEKSNFR